jgi:hypothetical protein
MDTKSSKEKVKEKPTMNVVALSVIAVFYLIIILISSYSGFIYGKQTNMTALGLSAGFCLSSVLCIILWVNAGRKIAGVCW